MMLTKEYAFLAIFNYEDDGIDIYFPDLPALVTCAFSDEEGLFMSEQLLNVMLNGTKVEDIPKPSLSNEIALKPSEKLFEIKTTMCIDNAGLIGRCDERYVVVKG